jgi:SAM-dependent methyltransferase
MRTLATISISGILLASVIASAHGLGDASTSRQKQVESRDMTDGKTWIERLERPDRTPGLRIDDVAACLNLRPGVVLADIGAGAGAFTLPFAEAVRPSGRILAVDLWPDLLDYIAEKARKANLDNVEIILGRADDPNLPKNEVDIAFFHDVFHNVPDRQAYLAVLAKSLKPDGRIAIIEQEFDDPIAQKWDMPENRITKRQLDGWMSNVGFHLVDEFDIFQGENNPKGAGMPERWFVVYARKPPE